MLIITMAMINIIQKYKSLSLVTLLSIILKLSSFAFRSWYFRLMKPICNDATFGSIVEFMWFHVNIIIEQVEIP